MSEPSPKDDIEAQWRLGISTEGWTDTVTELYDRTSGGTEIVVILHRDCVGGGMRAACGESLMFQAAFLPELKDARPLVCTVCLRAWRKEL